MPMAHDRPRNGRRDESVLSPQASPISGDPRSLEPPRGQGNLPVSAAGNSSVIALGEHRLAGAVLEGCAGSVMDHTSIAEGYPGKRSITAAWRIVGPSARGTLAIRAGEGKAVGCNFGQRPGRLRQARMKPGGGPGAARPPADTVHGASTSPAGGNLTTGSRPVKQWSGKCGSRSRPYGRSAATIICSGLWNDIQRRAEGKQAGKLIVGRSAPTIRGRVWEFKTLPRDRRSVAGAYLMVDMAHFARTGRPAAFHSVAARPCARWSRDNAKSLVAPRGGLISSPLTGTFGRRR